MFIVQTPIRDMIGIDLDLDDIKFGTEKREDRFLTKKLENLQIQALFLDEINNIYYNLKTLCTALHPVGCEINSTN